jgi:hypothetical protein
MLEIAAGWHICSLVAGAGSFCRMRSSSRVTGLLRQRATAGASTARITKCFERFIQDDKVFGFGEEDGNSKGKAEATADPFRMTTRKAKRSRLKLEAHGELELAAG